MQFIYENPTAHLYGSAKSRFSESVRLGVIIKTIFNDFKGRNDHCKKSDQRISFLSTLEYHKYQLKK